MSSGLYQDHIIANLFQTSAAAGALAQKWVVPADADVLGMIVNLGTAPGTNDGLTVNVSDSPTSQTGGGGTNVSAYNLWTAANVPTILGTNTNNLVVSQSNVFYGAQTLVKNVPYALNYPLPGPSGTSGYVTAQSTSQTTEVPVTSPPTQYAFGITGFGSVAPDNTYTDYNGNTLVPASFVHAGDVLTFTIAAAGSGNSVGAAANINIELVCSKR